MKASTKYVTCKILILFVHGFVCSCKWRRGSKASSAEKYRVYFCVCLTTALCGNTRLCLILLIFCPEICWIGLGNSNLWSHQQSLKHQLLEILMFYFYTSIKTTVECCDNPSRTGITESPQVSLDINPGSDCRVSGWTWVISGQLGCRKSMDGHIKVKSGCLEREFTNSWPSGGLNILWWLKGWNLREKQRLKTQKEKWGLKKGRRPIRKAGTEKEWEAKVVWEVSKERGQKVEAGEVWWG